MTIAAADAPPAAPGPVPQWLAAAWQVVQPALRQTVDTLHPDLARMARYHKGWTDAEGHPDTQARPGKGVRPALALWSAQAVDAAPQTAIPAAVAVELLHDYSLVHDDIMDDDRTRRGRPTVWVVYGIGPAILLGDAMHAAAHHVLATAGPRGHQAAARLAHTSLDLCRGQAADLQFEHRDQVAVQEYLAMIEGKTAALMRCAATLGAVLAGADHSVVTELDRLGLHLGMLFQIVDDLLGVFGDAAVTGKPAHSDLRRHKKTLPVLAALASASAAGRELATLLREPDPDEQDLRQAVELIDAAGGRARARNECAWHRQQALATLGRLKLATDADTMCRELIAYLLDRTT